MRRFTSRSIRSYSLRRSRSDEKRMRMIGWSLGEKLLTK
jgi:hypothetical protein